MTVEFAIVIPTIGRESLQQLLSSLDTDDGPAPVAVVVVDDRPAPTETPIATAATRLPVTVLHSGGRGPAAARNVGWRRTQARWVCFLDDDVLPGPDWLTAVTEDLADAEARGATLTRYVPLERLRKAARSPALTQYRWEA